jgi:xanthine dehydrogenase YagR molybdenum-binding subunit
MNVGQSIDRLDARRKVQGKATYAAEFVIPNTVHAVLVQSTVAAGKISGIDTSSAQAMPGVLAIITNDNAEKLHHDAKAQQTVAFPLLQNNDVLYNGQHIAVVVANTLQQAQRAAEKLAARYQTAEAVTSMDGVLDQAYEPKAFDNGRSKATSKVGDPDSAANGAAARVDATYETPIEHHNPMEPHATIAAWDGDRLTVWTATQGISGARQTLAGLFGIDKENVTIICPFVGGGFGCKGNTWPHVALTAMAARQVKRPVKLELTRQQMFTSNGYRPRTIQKITLAANSDGKLLAIRHDCLAQMSRPEVGEFAESAAKISRMLYACDNISTSHRVVSVNQGLPTYMRAPGEASGNFALESAMDELAIALRIDPLELRLRNYADTDPTEQKPFASKGLRACYEQGAKAFDWSRRTPEPGSMRDGKMLIGMGMATATYPTNRMPASALVRYLADGTVLVQSGTQDIGTGTYTTMAQVASDELGVSIDKIRVNLGDSRLPAAPVSGGSMTSASVLPAVREAAAQVRDKIFALAGANNGEADSRQLRDGMVTGSGEPVKVADLMARGSVNSVEATADAKPGDDASKYSRHAFGAQFAEVRIDPDLRTIKVSRFVGAFDCGKVINAKTARSQLIGGIVFGIGMALLEQTRVDAEFGRTVNSNIADYLMPVNADIPDIETITVEAPDMITTPIGVKGIGELPMVGVAAAIANAVYHATGTRVRELPIRLDKIMA